MFLLANGNYDWHVGPIIFIVSQSEHILKIFFILTFALLPITFYFTDIEFWLYLILCFVPFEFTKPFLSMPSLTPLDYICTGAIISMLARFPWKLQALKVIGIFGAWGTTLWICFWSYCIIAAHVLKSTPRASLRWIGFCFCFFLAAEVVKEDDKFQERLLSLLTVLGTCIAASGIYQFMLHPTYVQLEALFNQHNIFAAFLSFCLPAQFGNIQISLPRYKSVKWLCLIITFVAFILSYSRGAWLGIALGTLLVFALTNLARQSITINKRFIVLLMAGFFILGAFVVRQPAGRGLFSDSGRGLYLKTGWNIFKSHPWVGLGPGRYASQIHSYITPQGLLLYVTDAAGRPADYWCHLHNLYLQMLVEYGLLGFILWGGGFGLCVYRAWQALSASVNQKTSLKPYFFISIVAFLVHNSVDIITLGSFDMVFAVILATTAFSSNPLKPTA